MQIAHHSITQSSPAFVIAEIGHNHQGSIDICKAIIKAAADCGVDAVKLQKRDNRTLYTEAMYNRPYNSENAFGATYGEHREALEFGWEQYVELQRYAEALGLVFFATAFDIPSADFLRKLGVPCFKMASADLKSLPLLLHIAKQGRPMLISTGGGTMQDVYRAYQAVYPINPDIALLQCTATYPVEPEEMNLRVIETYRACFPGIVIGLSDHHSGIFSPPVGYALGARIFEKHFTLNRTWKGTDQAFSLDPSGMRRVVRDLKRVYVALGDGVKHPYPSEEPGLYKMGKSLVITRDLLAGHTLMPSDLTMQSPAEGLPPTKYGKMLGRRLRAHVPPGALTSTGILEEQ